MPPEEGHNVTENGESWDLMIHRLSFLLYCILHVITLSFTAVLFHNSFFFSIRSIHLRFLLKNKNTVLQAAELLKKKNRCFTLQLPMIRWT